MSISAKLERLRAMSATQDTSRGFRRPKGQRGISRTAAKRQAHQESSMYRQGSGWIVSLWSDSHRLNITTGELPFAQAKAGLATWRRERTEALRGHA